MCISYKINIKQMSWEIESLIEILFLYNEIQFINEVG